MTRLADRWIDVAPLGFTCLLGLWTVACNLVVFTGHSFHDLLRLSPVVVVAALALTWWLGRAPGKTVEAAPVMAAEPAWGFLLLAAVPVALFVATGDYRLYWGGAVLILAVALARRWRAALAPAPAAPVSPWLLAGLCVLAAATYFVVHRVHADDAFYLNMAVSALDHPDAPLLRDDDMHGRGLSILLPVYRLHSIELLGAAFAAASGLSHILVHSLLLGLVLAPLAVCALGVLLRQLTPRHWGAALAALVLVMALITARSVTFEVYSFGRIHQGKAVLVSLLVPLIFAYALRFAAAGGVRHWLMLALAQVAAVGASSTALYVAPLAAGLALAGTVRDWGSLRRALAGLLACAYPLGAGVAMMRVVADESPVVAGRASDLFGMEWQLDILFGHDVAAWLILWGLVGGWAALRDAGRQRALIAAALLFLAVFMNPWTMEFWARHVTGMPTFRRLWWALPVHAPLALLLVAPLLLPRPAWRWGGLAAAAAAAAVGFGVLTVPGPRYPMLTPDMYSTITYVSRPRVKLPLAVMPVVGRIHALLPERTVILAPFVLARWFVALPRHPYPLVATPNWIEQMQSRFGAEEAMARLHLLTYVDGNGRDPEGLRRAVERFRLGAVILPPGHPHADEIRSILLPLGWSERAVDGFAVLAATFREP